MTSLMSLPRVVVFDFNGTLFDDIHVAYGSVQKTFKVYGVPCPTIEQYREEITANYMKFYHNHGISRTVTESDLNKIRNQFYKENGGAAKIRPCVDKTIDFLSFFSIRLAIVSAESSTNLYRQLIRQGNLQRRFDFIKPDACGRNGKEVALLQTAEVFGCHPTQMIYVDDSVDGLTAAENVGVIPVAFTNPTGYNSEHRLMQVTSFGVREIWDIRNLLSGR